MVFYPMKTKLLFATDGFKIDLFPINLLQTFDITFKLLYHIRLIHMCMYVLSTANLKRVLTAIL